MSCEGLSDKELHNKSRLELGTLLRFHFKMADLVIEGNNIAPLLLSEIGLLPVYEATDLEKAARSRVDHNFVALRRISDIGKERFGENFDAEEIKRGYEGISHD